MCVNVCARLKYSRLLERLVARRHDGSHRGVGWWSLSHFLLDLSDGLRWIQSLGACPGAVHNRVASVQTKGVLQLLSPLVAKVISRVGHPSVRLHEYGGAEVLVLVPPVRWAGRRAACAEDALVQTV